MPNTLLAFGMVFNQNISYVDDLFFVAVYFILLTRDVEFTKHPS